MKKIINLKPLSRKIAALQLMLLIIILIIITVALVYNTNSTESKERYLDLASKLLIHLRKNLMENYTLNF